MFKTRSGRICFALIIFICGGVIARNGYKIYLHIACAKAVSSGDVEAVRSLLARGIVLDSHSSLDRGNLNMAAASGNLPIVNLLLAHGARPTDDDVNIALHNHSYAIAEAFYAHADPPGSLSYSSWLTEAVASGNTALAQKLLDRGADVQSAPLMLACARGDLPMAQLLLERGANPNVVDLTVSPLLCAGSGAYPAMNYASIQLPPSHLTPERSAALTRLLLAHKADVNARNGGGYTMLMLAAQSGNIAATKHLLAIGADARLTSKDGKTALMYAQKRKHNDIARLLQEAN